MKKLRVGLVALFLAFAMIVTMFPAQNAYAATSVSKVTGVSSTRSTGTSIKVAWSKVKGAKGYQVYMKTGTGSFKKVKTTTSKSYVANGLTLGQSYCFKIRAYKTSNGKNYYGNFSSVTRKILTKWEYLTVALHSYDYAYSAYAYDGKNTFSMGGLNYSFGLEFDGWNRYAAYNLEGKYTKITFDWGAIEEHDSSDTSSAQIYADDTLIATYTRNQGDLPVSITVDVTNVYKLKFVSSDGYYAGFGNIKLYY